MKTAGLLVFVCFALVSLFTGSSQAQQQPLQLGAVFGTPVSVPLCHYAGASPGPCVSGPPVFITVQAAGSTVTYTNNQGVPSLLVGCTTSTMPTQPPPYPTVPGETCALVGISGASGPIDPPFFPVGASLSRTRGAKAGPIYMYWFRQG